MSPFASRRFDRFGSVIDPKPWLSMWRSRFESLEIQWLRSPAVAHPDIFDAFSLQSFAMTQGREGELLDSGAADSKDVRGLFEVSGGAWRLPSNALFQDFCNELIGRLPHHFHKANVEDIQGSDVNFTIVTSGGSTLTSAAVVLGLGVPGLRVMPAALAQLPGHLTFHTEEVERLAVLLPSQRVLVIGGGLTAIQAAHLAHRRGCQVVLCSRRPLTTRHFDVEVKWFDRRRAFGCHYKFLSLPSEERVRMIKETRGGGSVPHLYMEDLKARVAAGGLEVVCGEVEVVSHDSTIFQARIDVKLRSFDMAISACGHRPQCTSLSLVNGLQTRFPVPLAGACLC